MTTTFTNCQSEHKMAKLGDLSEDEKSLFLHLNKGKETVECLLGISKLISY